MIPWIRHNSHSYPAAAARFGLFDTLSTRDDPPAGAPAGVEVPGALVGVAVFGIPVQAAVLTRALPGLVPYVESLELSRFVLDDACPGNSESWFLARCFTELLAAGVRGVVSFADPVPRSALDGTIIAPGHLGVIYQASNAVYLGRGTARTLTVLGDGTVLNARSAQKVRGREPGHEYVEQKLIGFGATAPTAGQGGSDWLTQALNEVGARRLRHRGAHRYVFRLGTNARARNRIELGLPVSSVYPKSIDTA